MSIRSGLRALLGAAAGAILMLPPHASATLGEGMASLLTETQRSAGVARIGSSADGGRVHVLSLADGSTVRQYLTPAGQVYAVAWSTHYKPRLDLLLGRYFPAYAEGGRRAMQQRPGVRHSAVIESGDLVVESIAHLNAHVGRAYLRSLIPAGTAADAIR